LWGIFTAEHRFGCADARNNTGHYGLTFGLALLPLNARQPRGGFSARFAAICYRDNCVSWAFRHKSRLSASGGALCALTAFP